MVEVTDHEDYWHATVTVIAADILVDHGSSGRYPRATRPCGEGRLRISNFLETFVQRHSYINDGKGEEQRHFSPNQLFICLLHQPNDPPCQAEGSVLL